MPKQTRSDDFIDGLQTAYTLVFNMQQKAAAPVTQRFCQGILVEINKLIENASTDKPRIIIP